MYKRPTGHSLDKESIGMSNYLTKEEIKQWRSSLEKMTLEEFAEKLGKKINNEKETNDIVDKVLKPKISKKIGIDEYKPKAETIKSIAQKTIQMEHELADKYNFRIKTMTSIITQENNKKVDNNKFIEPIPLDVENKTLKEYQFIKKLTPREQAVFDYFLKNKGQIVYAKELAELLNLPKDYIYKYIKTLRNKTVGECIVNAENGGFILK